MYDHTFLNLQFSTRSDIRSHMKLAVSLMICIVVTLIFLRGLCGYTLPPRGNCILELTFQYASTESYAYIDDVVKHMMTLHSHTNAIKI